MLEGTVTLFDRRGYGFIRPSDGSQDVFFHCSELPGEPGKRFISPGCYVRYDLGTRQGKTVAKNVKPLVEKGVGDEEQR